MNECADKVELMVLRYGHTIPTKIVFAGRGNERTKKRLYKVRSAVGLKYKQRNKIKNISDGALHDSLHVSFRLAEPCALYPKNSRFLFLLLFWFCVWVVFFYLSFKSLVRHRTIKSPQPKFIYNMLDLTRYFSISSSLFILFFSFIRSLFFILDSHCLWMCFCSRLNGFSYGFYVLLCCCYCHCIVEYIVKLYEYSILWIRIGANVVVERI